MFTHAVICLLSEYVHTIPTMYASLDTMYAFFVGATFNLSVEVQRVLCLPLYRVVQNGYESLKKESSLHRRKMKNY